jgi:hypothetical protein
LREGEREGSLLVRNPFSSVKKLVAVHALSMDPPDNPSHVV